MKKGKGLLVDSKIAELEMNIENAVNKAREEAANIGIQNNWTDELAEKYANFLIANDPRFDTEGMRKEIDYIQTNFCEEVPDEDIQL